MSRDWQRLKVTIGLVSDRFGSQTDITTFDIDFHIVPENRPVIFSGNKFLSFFDSEMTSKWVVMISADELCSDNFWYKKEALMV